MENIMPILLSVSGIFLGLSILVKVLIGMKFKRIKYRKPKGLIEFYMLFAASVLMMWFPYKYKEDNLKLQKLKRRINITTYVFYGLVLIEGLLVYIQIIKNGM